MAHSSSQQIKCETGASASINVCEARRHRHEPVVETDGAVPSAAGHGRLHVTSEREECLRAVAHHPGRLTRSVRIASAYAGVVFVLCSSGCRTPARGHSRAKPTGSPLSWPRTAPHRTSRRSSMPSPSGRRSEARRDLDRGRRSRRCRQTQTRRHTPGRRLRCYRVDHNLPLHFTRSRCTADASLYLTIKSEWTEG